MDNPISKTAYYTLGCRFWDAEKTNPICNDTYAHVFMNEEAHAIAELFKSMERPNASIVVRHRLISGYLDEAIAKNPSLLIINIGCGFDTRPFRHTGGRWVEVDEPPLIAYKDTCLPPSEAKNPLTRISIDFGKESLREKLLPFRSVAKTVIVAEGVMMYLSESEQQNFLGTIKELFPRHMFCCDLMSHSFMKNYSQDLLHQIRALGANFAELAKNPEAIFLKAGYQVKRRTSSPLHSAELGAINIPAWLIRYCMPTLRDGLSVYEFEHAANRKD